VIASEGVLQQPDAERLAFEPRMIPIPTGPFIMGSGDVATLTAASIVALGHEAADVPAILRLFGLALAAHVDRIPAHNLVLNGHLAAGDLIIPLQNKMLEESDIHGEIGQVVTGEIPGRASDFEVTFFKSVGLAVQDLATASLAFERAEALHSGITIDL